MFMTVHEIHPEISLPAFARNLSLEELDSALEQFPYAGTLFIAKAVKLHDLQDIQFLDALPKAAARTISRTHLKRLVEGPIELSFEWIPKVEVEFGDPDSELIDLEEAITHQEMSSEGSFEAEAETGEKSETGEISEPEEDKSFEEVIEAPKVNAFGFSFVKVKTGKKKPTLQEPFDIQKVGVGKSYKPRKNPDSVIEKFLENTPSISSPRIDFGGNTAQPDLSVQSTSLNEDIVTENMALIYLKQRNFEKALEIYRRLQLKFPEKSAFFAALIKNIENTIV